MVEKTATQEARARAARAADVTGWRRHQLLAVGFKEPLASRLAETPGVDLHEVLSLVDRGCPPELAARILAPVTETDAADVTR